MTYRNDEVHFIVQNDPTVARTVERWNTPIYVTSLLKSDVNHRVEYRERKTPFMYYKPLMKRNHRLRKGGIRIQIPQNWTRPTEVKRMSYQHWRWIAIMMYSSTNDEYWYFRSRVAGKSVRWATLMKEVLGIFLISYRFYNP